MRKAILMSGLILSCMSPAFAQFHPPSAPVVWGPPPSIPPPAPDRAYRRLVSELAELRQIGLELRASDGGTLTAEHRDSLQMRIDAAFAVYRRHHNSGWQRTRLRQ